MSGKRRRGTTCQPGLAPVLRKIMEQFLMKTLHWHMRTWTPKVSSSLIFFLICGCFASFTSARWLWPVLLSVLLMRRRRNNSKHLWLLLALNYTFFSLKTISQANITLRLTLGKYIGKVWWNKRLHKLRALGHCSLLSCLLDQFSSPLPASGCHTYTKMEQ